MEASGFPTDKMFSYDYDTSLRTMLDTMNREELLGLFDSGNGTSLCWERKLFTALALAMSIKEPGFQNVAGQAEY